MKAISKLIASVTACAVMVVSSAVTASAKTVDCGGAALTGTLSVASTSATGVTSIDHLPSTVSVSVVGYYYEKGTFSKKTTSNGAGSANGGCSATVYNGGGAWYKVDSTHTGYYNGASKIFYNHW